MAAYYNEIDAFAAQWLRNLIAAGHIAPGDVDERDIRDVRPDDLRGYEQCHFFAGIGVWSLALRRAGWTDDRPVWTGSCPCQPFSAAGAGLGFSDERHLWPHWHWLISECRPPVVIGEQVASSTADDWVDLVQADVEGLDYAYGCVPFPAAGVSAPHIRDRNYWMAYAQRRAAKRHRLTLGVTSREMRGEARQQRIRNDAGDGIDVGRLADTQRNNRRRQADPAENVRSQTDGSSDRVGGRGGASGGMANPGSERFYGERLRIQPRGSFEASAEDGWRGETCGMGDAECDGLRIGGRKAANLADQPSDGALYPGALGACAADGFWRTADWLLCRDGKWRPVEPQPQPLVDGSAESLGLVRADIIAALTEEINATAMEAKVIGAEAMRNVFENLGAEAKRCWPTRGLPGLHEAPFLLAFVRQLSSQGWIFAQGIPLPRPEVTGQSLRGVRDDETAASASHRRGLDEQRAGERPDVVRVLSCVLARHAQTAWGEAYKTYAAIGFPLSTGEAARVGRLRAYGNAINAEAARVFIESVMESLPC